MKKHILREHIIASYDIVMGSYLENDDHKHNTLEINKWWLSLRRKLTVYNPALGQEFDDFLSAYENMARSESEEAYYRGIIAGISERESTFGNE